jgi:stage III sporulation protein AA
MELESKKIYKYLPLRIYLLMLKIPENAVVNLNEIRLRVGLPLSLSFGNRNLSVNDSGKLCRPEEGTTVTGEEMKECISKLTRSSLYSYDETIKYGYIPLEEGCRAGICGDAVTSKNGIKTFSSIKSVSLRVSRLYPDLAKPLAEYFDLNGICGTLVFSPPGLGKTTYLRSAAYLLSRGNKPLKVGIADERSELFVPEMTGCLIDYVRNCKKREGIDLLTRTMSPQVIICDEISDAEVEGIIEAQNSGVCLIASCHGESLEGIMKRPHIHKMTEKGIFRLFVRLWQDGGYKSEIITREQ